MNQELTSNQKIIVKRLYELETPIDKIVEIMAFLQQEKRASQLAQTIKTNSKISLQEIMIELAKLI